MESIKNYNADGLCPDVTFNAKEHRGQKGCKIYTIKNGEVLPYSDKVFAFK